ncbi:MAG: hypothetical protein KIT72_18270 [Polyangiaceae bacterium]|nr:hypothetical protein [Polyangiaceae bacterium]MCW5792363.1 hypothetical protein [Polyangiaceae bacterium]
MSAEDRDSSGDRAMRAALRRAIWGGEVVPSGAPKPPLHDGRSLEERIAHVWPLTKRLWLLAGGTLTETPRHELPGEVFDIHAERGRAPD